MRSSSERASTPVSAELRFEWTGARRRGALLLRALAWGVVFGAVIGATRGSAFREAPFLGTMLGAFSGIINGVTLAAAIFGAEIFLPPTRLGHALERAPFFVTFAIKLLVYGALIVFVAGGLEGGSLGSRLREPVAAVMLGPDLAKAFYVQVPAQAGGVLAGFLILGYGLLVLQMSRLVGQRTLRDIVFGRYHRSRAEERFFLFVDIIGSTSLAERIGPEAIHRFLGEVFRLASDPIDDCRGEVYQYVGDEIVMTWTVAAGRGRARPLACFFAIEQALQRSAPQFEREFGVVPGLRAALHAGPVITGEVGGSRRAIVFHGDVMNTTSRIEQATRDLERQFLVSEGALERLDDLDGFALEDLGPQRLRGRTATVHVYAVTAKPSTADQETT